MSAGQPPAPENAIVHAARLVRAAVPPMHPAGRPFVLGGIAATVALRGVSARLAALGAVGTAATALFFREPHRVPPPRTDLAVAPADGIIASITEAAPPPELGTSSTPRTRVSVFLSMLDVHVQRVPATGEVLRTAYRPGTFLSADLDKASEDNERNATLLRTDSGVELAVVQIAGLIARRIVCHIHAGDAVSAGQTYGLIRFGSRVDLYLPPGSRLLVTEGQRAIGGETAVAELAPAVPRSEG